MVKNKRLVIKVATLIVASSAAFSPSLVLSQYHIAQCLYGGFTQGNETTSIEPCGDDLAQIGSDVKVRAVMRTFNILSTNVVFKSCRGGRFSARPDGDGEDRFLITYPNPVGSNYLAPIVHELAHVVQMQVAGSREALRLENSRRIELGADFLAGLAFSKTLTQEDSDDFRTNLRLAGSYKIQTQDHGLPEHRDQAFRRGLIRAYPYQQLTIIESLAYWNNNDYSQIR